MEMGVHFLASTAEMSCVNLHKPTVSRKPKLNKIRHFGHPDAAIILEL